MKLAMSVITALVLVLAVTMPSFASDVQQGLVIAGIPVPQEVLDRCSPYLSITYTGTPSNPIVTLTFPSKSDPASICAVIISASQSTPRFIENTVKLIERIRNALITLGCWNIGVSYESVSGSSAGPVIRATCFNGNIVRTWVIVPTDRGIVILFTVSW